MKNLLSVTALFAIALISFAFGKEPKASALSKSLVYPVAAKNAYVGSVWGDERDGGKRKHKGIDIFARKGTPVVAVSEGVIVSKGVGKVAGKYLWLRSSKTGLTSYYAHLDKFNVNEGARVKKGQVLGTVGNTGNARTTPSHLHFGIYRSNGAVNPLPYVKNSPKIRATMPPKKTASKTKTVSKKARPKKK